MTNNVSSSLAVDIKKISALSMIYLTACSALYLLIYWESFNVQIFEYITLTEIVSLSVPYITIVAVYIFGVIVDSALFGRVEGDEKKHNDDFSKNKFIISIVVLLVSVVAVIILNKIYIHNPLFYMVVLPEILPICYIAAKANILKKEICNYSLRLFLTSVLLYLPVGAVILALTNAEYKNNGKSDYILSDQTNLDVPKNEKLIFIGKAGDYFFFKRLSTGNTLIITLKDINLFELKSTKNP